MKDWSDCDGNYIVNMKNLFHEIEIILLFFSQRASRCRVWGCLGDIPPPPSLVEDRSYLYQVVKCCLERENLLESFVTLKVWLSQGSPALQADISALWNNTGLGGIFSLEITLQGLRSIKRTGGRVVWSAPLTAPNQLPKDVFSGRKNCRFENKNLQFSNFMFKLKDSLSGGDGVRI